MVICWLQGQQAVDLVGNRCRSLRDYGSLSSAIALVKVSRCYEFWQAYKQVLPSMRHQAMGKERAKTSYIEQFNNTLRQSVGRLLPKTLSNSCAANHIGAIWYFVHQNNALLRS